MTAPKLPVLDSKVLLNIAVRWSHHEADWHELHSFILSEIRRNIKMAMERVNWEGDYSDMQSKIDAILKEIDE